MIAQMHPGLIPDRPVQPGRAGAERPFEFRIIGGIGRGGVIEQHINIFPTTIGGSAVKMIPDKVAQESGTNAALRQLKRLNNPQGLPAKLVGS